MIPYIELSYNRLYPVNNHVIILSSDSNGTIDQENNVKSLILAH